MQEEYVWAAQVDTADALPDGDGNWQNERMSVATQSSRDAAPVEPRHGHGHGQGRSMAEQVETRTPSEGHSGTESAQSSISPGMAANGVDNRALREELATARSEMERLMERVERAERRADQLFDKLQQLRDVGHDPDNDQET